MVTDVRSDLFCLFTTGRFIQFSMSFRNNFCFCDLVETLMDDELALQKLYQIRLKNKQLQEGLDESATKN